MYGEQLRGTIFIPVKSNALARVYLIKRLDVLFR